MRPRSVNALAAPPISAAVAAAGCDASPGTTAAPDAAMCPDASAPAPAPAPRIVLVVEDDPAVRHVLLHALRAMNLQPIGFGSGEAAIAWIELNGPPALVSVDVCLPRMSGFRFGEWLRSHEPTRAVPAVMVTARAGIDDEARALELEAAFLVKPLHIREYQAVVRELIGINGLDVTKSSSPQAVHFWSKSLER